MLRIEKPSFIVIGKEGSTRDGEGFIQRLWLDANTHFSEVAALAKRDSQGQMVGVWGAMSDFSRGFAPWENGFTQGLYLAGVECQDGTEAPPGWVKWVIPGYHYVQVSNADGNAFLTGLSLLKDHGLTLVGAVHDYTDPTTGQGYMMFPVEKL